MSVYRLTRFDEVVGFSKKAGSYELFSKDLYGWNGKHIDYDHKEADTGYRDKNNRRIFVHDVLQMSYYRNPVALKMTGEYLLQIKLNKKGRVVCEFIESREIRPIDFLEQAISLDIKGRSVSNTSTN